MSTVFEHGHALLIGVGADLANTVDDAKGLARLLHDPTRCAYPPEQVHLLTGPQATADGILTRLKAMATQTDTDSTVVVYFSGHGYEVTTPIDKMTFLMPFGYDTANLTGTAISGKAFTDALAAIPCQKLLLLLDCCHAGGVDQAKSPDSMTFAKSPLPAEALELLETGNGRVVIASSRADEKSFAGKPFSAFTLALIEALSGIGVAEQDGYVRVADLALHAREKVPARTRNRQHPILHFAQADNFVVATYAGGDTKPKGLPFSETPEIESEPGALQRAAISYAAKLDGDGAIAQGTGATAVGAGGFHFGGNINAPVHINVGSPTPPPTPPAESFGPKSVPAGSPNPPVDLNAWAAALEQSPSIQNPATRQAIIQELPAEIRNNLNATLPNLNTQLRDLVRTSQNYAGGLEALVSAVGIIEGRSLAVQALEALLNPVSAEAIPTPFEAQPFGALWLDVAVAQRTPVNQPLAVLAFLRQYATPVLDPAELPAPPTASGAAVHPFAVRVKAAHCEFDGPDQLDVPVVVGQDAAVATFKVVPRHPSTTSRQRVTISVFHANHELGNIDMYTDVTAADLGRLPPTVRTLQLPTPHAQKLYLRQMLSARFTMNDLKNLVERLGRRWDNLAGSTLDEKARELVISAEFSDDLGRVYEYMQEAKPKLDWTFVPVMV